MKTKKLKKKVSKFVTHVYDDYPEGRPKHFGDAKVTSFEIKGLTDSFCMCAAWPNGEGFDFSIHSKNDDKSISLHTDQIEVMLACLNHLDYFKLA